MGKAIPTREEVQTSLDTFKEYLDRFNRNNGFIKNLEVSTRKQAGHYRITGLPKVDNLTQMDLSREFGETRKHMTGKLLLPLNLDCETLLLDGNRLTGILNLPEGLVALNVV